MVQPHHNVVCVEKDSFKKWIAYNGASYRHFKKLKFGDEILVEIKRYNVILSWIKHSMVHSYRAGGRTRPRRGTISGGKGR